MNKEKPRKIIGNTFFFSGCCPNCKEYILFLKAEIPNIKYCPYCGQHVIWGDEE